MFYVFCCVLDKYWSKLKKPTNIPEGDRGKIEVSISLRYGTGQHRIIEMEVGIVHTTHSESEVMV